MGSSCSSAQKKKEKKRKGCSPEGRRRSSVRSTDSLPYGKEATPPPATPVLPAAPLPAAPVHQNGATSPQGTSKRATPHPGTISSCSGHIKQSFGNRESAQDGQKVAPPLDALLMGRPEDQDSPCSRQLGLYVCSALRDTLPERSLLAERVYPAVRQHAAKKGYDLCLADVHWGLCWDAVDGALLSRICLATLERLRARGRLLTLVPAPSRQRRRRLPRPPRRVGAERLRQRASDAYEECLVRYYARLRTSIEDSEFQLQHTRDSVDSFASRSLWETRSKALEKSRKMASTWEQFLEKNESLGPSAWLSVLEQEVRAAVLSEEQRPQDCVWLERRWTHRPRSETAGDDDSAKRYGALRSQLEDRLPEAHKLVVRARWAKEGPSEDALSETSDLLERALCALVDGAAEADSAAEASRPCRGVEPSLQTELWQQAAWLRRLGRNFVGRSDAVVRLERYVRMEHDGRPLVVHGPPGCGKSALVARAATECADWLPDAPVVARFVGASPASPEQFLRTVCEHCCALCGVHPAEVSVGPAEQRAALGRLLERAGPDRPLVLILDGLEQLGDGPAWDWLPTRLPPHVRLVLTLRDGCPQLAQLQEELDSDCLLPLGPCSGSDCEAIVRGSLEQSGYTLTPEQWTLVSNSVGQSRSPLHACLLANLAVCWSPADTHSIDGTLESVVAEVLKQADRDVGPKLVAFVLGLLSAARHGLTDAEIVDVLSRHPDVFAHCPHLDGTPKRCPFGVWALLRTSLRGFLCSRVVAGRVLHTWRGDACRTALCSARIDADTARACALALVEYFSVGSDDEARSLTELPYITLRMLAGSPADVAALQRLNCDGLRDRFLDAEWLESKLRVSRPWVLLEELRMHLELQPGDAECRLLSETIELAAYALRYDGRQLAAQLWARLRRRLATTASELPRLAALCDTLRRRGTGLLPVSDYLREPGIETIFNPTDDWSVGLGQLYTIRGDAAHMVSLDGGDLRVWDVRGERVVRHLAGLSQPRDLKMVDGFRALVLCDRELRVYSLDEGRLLVKLKGVMNQKMAYFGLHGQDYAVALSRNRMYVNMLNLDSGDLETTFKVGEDRFLNSLLVSANGKICVCGDETQKPFPLLVWDLSRRKLLYDLRIPHHEFVTRLSAISGDGHYVVCVCRASPFLSMA
ncbi:unnamed protein product [Ixodes hexagonus]